MSEVELEQVVFYEIFPLIMDSIYYDSRLIPPPPPRDFLKRREGKDEISYEKEYEKKMRDWGKKKDSIKQDSASIYLIVNDSINNYKREDLNELLEHFKGQNIVIGSSENVELNKGYKIDLRKLKTNYDRLEFKYRSQFPKGRELWRTEYDFYIGASIEFSRILFDETKSYGVLNVGYTTGVLSGHGVKIFIKKNGKGKWNIDRIIGTWIS